VMGGPAKRIGGGPEPGEDMPFWPFINANMAGGSGGMLGPAVEFGKGGRMGPFIPGFGGPDGGPEGLPPGPRLAVELPPPDSNIRVISSI